MEEETTDEVGSPASMAVSETRSLFPVLEPDSRNKQRETPHSLCNLGASFLSVAQKAHSKLPQLPWPLASLSQTLTSIAAPLVHRLQYQCLALLYIIDEQILIVEGIAKNFFPASSHVFDKIHMFGDIMVDFLVEIESNIDYFSLTVDEYMDVNFGLASALGYMVSMLPQRAIQNTKNEEENISTQDQIEEEKVHDAIQLSGKLFEIDRDDDMDLAESGEKDGEGSYWIEETNQEIERNELEHQPTSDVLSSSFPPASDNSSSDDIISKDNPNIGVGGGPVPDPVLQLFDSRWAQL